MVERAAVNRDVVGSSPTSGAIFPVENDGFEVGRTDSAQNKPESDGKNVKFPKVIRNKKTKAEVTIYGKKPAYPFYRVCWRVAGRRMMKSVRTYSAAKKAADDLIDDLGSGSQKTALTVRQAMDALAALETLQGLYLSTGRRISLLGAVSEYAEASSKLNGRPLGEAVDGYIQTVAILKRKDLGEAVADFTEERKPLTESKDGERPRLDPVYASHVASCLQKFAATFPGTCVCDLAKFHFDRWIINFKDLSPKSRNHARGTVRMFLNWCVRKDYLAATHRLFEADGLKAEDAPSKNSGHYRPLDLRKMLDGADEQMRAVIAIQGFAGLRLDEVLRLDWEDVFRIAGHIEVSTSKSKTKQRRLVTICPALKQWLATYRGRKGRVVTEWNGLNAYVRSFVALLKNLGVTLRKNGLRHGFITFHYAMHSNENLTAAMAGNSPAIIHSNYRELATKAEAKKWFSIRPAEPAARKT
jgi:integrase